MSRDLPQAVFTHLCQQTRISGQALADTLGVSRAAIWKAIEYLRTCGLPIVAESGIGYRLATDKPVQPLDVDVIRRQLPAGMALQLLFETHSTNDHIRTMTGDGFVLAEHQRQGRGRMGRRWLSVPGCSVVLSGHWSFAGGIADLTGLNLAVAVAVLQTATACGWQMGVKWPNDLMHPEHSTGLRKMGGILIEVHGEMEGPCQAVVGLGLNWCLPAVLQQAIDQPVANLLDLPGMSKNAGVPTRSDFIARLLPALDTAIRRWCDPDQSSRATYRQAMLALWRQHDILRGQRVCLLPSHPGAPARNGIYRGVDISGALLLETGGQQQTVHSGEISLRPDTSPCASRR